jgi:hypothetical protein
MVRGNVFVKLSFGILFVLALVAAATAQQASLAAADIVNKNIAARGGLQAWRSVHTLTMSGKMEAGGNNRSTLPTPATHRGRLPVAQRPTAQAELPFKMELKRGRKLRLELEFAGQTSVQVYDGKSGWKLRPFLNRSDYEPYTSEESKAASEQSDLDGPLVDYAAKGTTVSLAGVEKVDGHDNYKLKLTLSNGYSFHVWIDSQTFLETKMEGTPRRLDGEYRPVEIYFRDYQSTNGLQIPRVLETRVTTKPFGPNSKNAQTISEKITIDNVVVNPKLDDSLFTKPNAVVAAGTQQSAPGSGHSVAQ